MRWCGGSSIVGRRSGTEDLIVGAQFRLHIAQHCCKRCVSHVQVTWRVSGIIRDITLTHVLDDLIHFVIILLWDTKHFSSCAGFLHKHYIAVLFSQRVPIIDLDRRRRRLHRRFLLSWPCPTINSIRGRCSRASDFLNISSW